jgi:3'-phosphoadenosine 5'-phosphosulfate sulfotransferase (PAPS reductase)/FAD synthetase
MNRHEKGDLKQLQSIPLSQKILMTQARIREWYEYFDGNVYVSFSGGKDSTVLKHIVDGIYDDIPAVFVNTGLEYPEIQKFVRDIKAGNSAASILM